MVHNGLGIRHDRRWQVLNSLLDSDDASPSFFAPLHSDHTIQAEPDQLFQADTFSADFLADRPERPMGATWSNPANGIAMMDSCLDVIGNPYGLDTMHDSQVFDHGLGDFGGSFSAFGFD